MKSLMRLFFGMTLAAIVPGCLFVPRTQYNASQAQNRALAEQNRAQLVEIENLKQHSRTLEERLVRNEEQLAQLEEQSASYRRQLAVYQNERDGLYDHVRAMSLGHGRLPADLGRQLAELSSRYPSLQFDPESGISKLDTDIMFDSGQAVLKPGAERLLDELARVLRSPAAGDLKIMVAGHTDNQSIADREVRKQFPNNLHLSAARALAVADRLKRAGMPEHRVAVAGFGPHQPIASNSTVQDRQKNRRVELFIMPAEAPVVGWSDSTPSVYQRGVQR